MTSELKPCTFCGGEANMYTSPSNMLPYAVGCTNSKCHIYSGYGFQLYETKQEAITAWNQRAERTCRNVDDYGDNIGGWRDWETDGFGFTCSECGHVLYPDEMGASPLAPELLAERVKISYCPHCGARVVR